MEGGFQADQLREVEVGVIGTQVCNNNYEAVLGRLERKIDGSLLCAGFGEGGRDACQGDSGGPLVHSGSQGVHTLVGIVSSGIGCARRDIPGLYTDVASLRGWIHKSIRE